MIVVYSGSLFWNHPMGGSLRLPIQSEEELVEVMRSLGVQRSLMNYWAEVQEVT